MINNDDELPPLSQLVGAFADYFEPEENQEFRMQVQKLRVNVPVELDLMIENKIRLTASTPTQLTETTVMPVFHQLHLTMELSEEDG